MPHRLRPVPLRLAFGLVVASLAGVSVVALLTYMTVAHATDTYNPTGWDRLWMVATGWLVVIGAMLILTYRAVQMILAHIDRRFEQIRTALVALGARVEDTGELVRTGTGIAFEPIGRASVSDNVRAFELGRRAGRQDRPD